MEGLPSFENRESVIDALIESLVEREEMNTEDIVSDLVTFAGILEEDEDAKITLITVWVSRAIMEKYK